MSEHHTTEELIDLLKRAQRLGLTFHIGTAYIRRSYIDAQTELNRLINEAIANVSGQPDQSAQLLSWVINNLLTESQLSVVPPGYDRPMRSMAKGAKP